MRRATRRGRRLDLAFSAEAGGLDLRSRRFLQELTFGVTRLQARLDHLIGRHVERGMERLDDDVLEVLRLGAYQVLYMDGVPHYAAVSQAVEQAGRRRGRHVRGLVNAVLRAVADTGAGPDLFPDPQADPVGFLSTWGSHPRWLVERWLSRRPPAEVRALVEADNLPPRLTLVPLDVEPDTAARRLMDEGIEAEPVGRGTRCVALGAGVDPRAALSVVPGVFQDPGANLVARYADPAPGTMIADLCAAPGGKAMVLSGRASYTVAADLSRKRLALIRDNARRTGRQHLGWVQADARFPPLRDAGMVLLDVPCTGTGTLRRHPDARWRLNAARVEKLAALQAGILEAGASLVHPGGLLVYATCTLEPEENEVQVDAFLHRHEDFMVEATRTVPQEYLNASGALEAWPQDTGFDGAYAARLRRVA